MDTTYPPTEAKRGPQEFSILASRRLRTPSWRIPEAHAVSERYRRHQISILLRKEPTGAGLGSANVRERERLRGRERERESESARRIIRLRERKTTAIIINNLAAQRHSCTMGVLLGRKTATINNAVIIKSYTRELGERERARERE